MHTCMDRGWWCRKEGTDRGCNVPGRSDEGKSSVREGGREGQGGVEGNKNDKTKDGFR